MTKVEREILSKSISNLSKNFKVEWQLLKEHIVDYGYQSFYPAQDEFTKPIHFLVNSLSDEEKRVLINEWKNKSERIQFETDEAYLKQYEAYIMEELVSRASKATCRM